jgi:hypothetical protein
MSRSLAGLNNIVLAGQVREEVKEGNININTNVEVKDNVEEAVEIKKETNIVENVSLETNTGTELNGSSDVNNNNNVDTDDKLSKIKAAMKMSKKKESNKQITIYLTPENYKRFNSECKGKGDKSDLMNQLLDLYFTE